MRIAALILISLLMIGPVSAPVMLLADAPATVPAHVKVQQTETKTETTEETELTIKNPQLQKSANTIRDLAGFLSVVIGIVGGVCVAAIKAYRALKAALHEHEQKTEESARRVAATAVTVAEKVATVTSAQMQAVRDTVTATAQQVTGDNDNTLRAIVQRHGEQIQAQTDTIQAHDREAVQSRRDMMDAMVRIDSKFDDLNKRVMDVLTIMATKK